MVKPIPLRTAHPGFPTIPLEPLQGAGVLKENRDSGWQDAPPLRNLWDNGFA